MPGEKTFDVPAAWGLPEAARLEPRGPYAEAAMANVGWALTHQRANGCFEDCCLTDSSQPLRYALRGLVEAHRFSNESALLDAAQVTAKGLLETIAPNGFLPGRLDSAWRGTVPGLAWSERSRSPIAGCTYSR